MLKSQVKDLIGQILKSSGQLSVLTKRPFTPDGHMVGSIGEIYAQEYYGVQLYAPSHQGHDGVWQKREVQIKATQRSSVDLKGPSDLLLVLKINPDGSFEEIYNGDGERPWVSLAHRRPTRAGEISISLVQLKELNKSGGQKDKIPRLI